MTYQDEEIPISPKKSCWENLAGQLMIWVLKFWPYLCPDLPTSTPHSSDQRQWSLACETLILIEIAFLRYPTCPLFVHVAWCSTALWRARTTGRTTPRRWLTLGSVTSSGIVFNQDVISYGGDGGHKRFLYF